MEKKLNHTFQNPSLLMSALTHKSYHHESEGASKGHSERLEFLGDAVLDLAVGSMLMQKYPELDEGPLSKMRASLVNETTLAEIALDLDLNQNILLSWAEMRNGGSLKPRLLASTYEAVVGALFCDAGYDKAYKFIEDVFRERLSHLDLTNYYSSDYKTHFQEKCQELFKQTPTYKVVKDRGPDHDKTFFVKVYVGNQVMGQGEGKSKKQAEQEAALQGLHQIESLNTCVSL